MIKLPGNAPPIQTAFVAGLVLLAALFSIAGATAKYDLETFIEENPTLYSQHSEETMIRHFFRDRRNGVFVDIGCAWPTRNSTTLFLERHLGWSGVGVDALSMHAPTWRVERPRSQFFNYAVTDTSGDTITFYQAAGVSSIYEEHSKERSKGEPVPIDVETITMDDLLEKAGIESIDFLSMDIEGAEPLALAGFDIDRFQPKLVCIEGRWEPKRSPAILQYFEEHGYELAEEYMQHEKANFYFRAP